MSALVKFLPSGNYFQNFKTIGTTMVSFDYCDRRRGGQVARRYLITFEKDSLKVVDIMAISANEGRVEHFSTCKMLETAKGLIRKARIEAFEAEFGAEIEALQAEKAKKEEEKKAAERAENIVLALLISAFVVLGVLVWKESVYAFVILWVIPLSMLCVFTATAASVRLYLWIKEQLTK